jgi:hypothetical protein
MTSLSNSSGRRAGGHRVAWVNQQYFVVLGLALVFSNTFTFLYHFSALSIFNGVSNAISIALVAYSILTILRAPGDDTTGRMFLLFAVVMTSVSVIYNFQVASFSDALKYLSIYIFYCAGRACGGRIRPVEVRCIYALAVLPIIFLFTGSSKVFADEDFFSAIFAYLPNANTAVLYFSALLFAVAQWYGERVILFQFINALLMNRIGAVVATAIAVGLWIAFPLRRESIVAFIFVGVAVLIVLPLGVFDRAMSVFENMMFIYRIEPSTVASMSFKELVQLTGSTDLSGFFRLIHWSNIWDLYTNRGIGTLLFGYGAGQTASLTYATLVPHNDYLRIFAEYGPFNLIIFVSFLLHIRSGLTTGATKVLFVVLCIYFFSENLLDNFTSMALYFAYAGRATATSRRPIIRIVSRPAAIAQGLTAR